MLNFLAEYFLEKPRRLTSLGAVLVRLGGLLFIAGLIGKVATTAKAAVGGLAGAALKSEVPLSDVLPGALSIWIPEGVLGFGATLALIVVGVVANRTGLQYERYLRG